MKCGCVFVGEAPDQTAAVDLYWLPLGAGGHFVRLNGRMYEAVKRTSRASAGLRSRPLALRVQLPEGN
jgi:hypothetical protein